MSPVSGDWRARLQQAVAPLERGVRGLQVNNFRPADEYAVRPGRTAAVLVPVLDLEQPELVLTLRARHLANHAGQVSFPGGAAEDGDSTAVTTALREAHEEIGLEPGQVKPIGFLDRFDTISDYRVLPVVGLVRPPDKWTIDPEEVDQVFTLPLEVALDRARYKEQTARRNEQTFVYHSLEWQGHLIWGLTAAMIRNLLSRMESL